MTRDEIPILPGAVTAIVVGLVYVLVATGGTLRFEQSAYPHHVLIADGWLHGQISVRDEALRPRREEFVQRVRGALENELAAIGAQLAEADWQQLQDRVPAPVMQDWSVVDGKFYGYWGLMPPLVLLPYVALAGSDASDVFASCLLGMGAVFLMFLVLRQAHRRCLVEGTTPVCVALSLLFGLGTVLFYLTVMAQVWFFSQIVATFFLCMAMYSILRTRTGVGWPLAAGAAFGAAILSRASILPTAAFFPLTLVALSPPVAGVSVRRLVRQGGAFLLPVMIAGGIAAAFNYARFGSPIETGLRIQTLTGAAPLFKHRYLLHGFFSWHYLAHNLYYYFINPGVGRTADTNALTFDPEGNSMFLVTPALLYVFLAHRRSDWFVRGLWLGTAGGMATLLLFFGTGFFQFGNRYLLDVIPFAMLLVAIGMNGRLTTVAMTLIGLSIAVNAWGTSRYYSEAQVSRIVAGYAAILHGTIADSHLSYAEALANRGKLQNAITNYEEVLRLRPDSVQAHTHLGNLLWAVGRHDDAVAQYEAALRVQPADAEAHNGLGRVLADEGKLAEAVAHFDTAVWLDPGLDDARRNLADARHRLEAAPASPTQ